MKQIWELDISRRADVSEERWGYRVPVARLREIPLV